MNILFLTLSFPDVASDSNIYSDLMTCLKEQGHHIYVLTCSERRYKKKTRLSVENGLNVLRVRTGNIQKTNILEKGISTLLIERQYQRALNKYWHGIRFNLVIYSTPPITFCNIVRHIKRKYRAKSYLLLKDIFPQNAVDIGLMKENGLLHRYFRAKEKRLYRYSDFIGCMSPANAEYIIGHNPEIPKSIVEVCPNSIFPSNDHFSGHDQEAVREHYGIPKEAFLCIYGGNLGKPQGINFLMDVLLSNKSNSDVYFLIIGSGTEYSRLNRFLEEHALPNVQLHPSMKKAGFQRLVEVSDCGLIFLDRRFTIPNFPSRLLSYMDASKPVLAATDTSTDLGKILMENGFGFWVESGNLDAFNDCLNKLIMDRDLAKAMGSRSKEYLINHYHVQNASRVILEHFIKE